MGAKSSKPVDTTVVDNKQSSPPIVAESEPTKTEDTVSGGGGCPMKRSDGSYSYSLGGMFGRGAKHPHGPKGSVPLEKQEPGSSSAKGDAASSSGCPVQHSPKQSEESSADGGCPVKHNYANASQQQQYNVYSQPIDPKNQMPNLNQLPSPQQTEELSTERVKSTIPKGGTEDESTTWTYPSPQMFYNALARKGKLDETKEDDMDSVVALHNNMNEKTWQKVLQWESVLGEESPKLLKFMGRPTDLSPKARFKHYVLGHPLPFDRHDWTIVRQDGTTHRYIIDYFYDETRASESEESAMPNMHDSSATPSLLVDVRPALDGPSSLLARTVQMPMARHVNRSTPFEPMPMMPTHEMKSQVTESIKVWDNIQKSKQNKKKVRTAKTEEKVSVEEATQLAKSFASILNDCQKAKTRLENSKTDDEMTKASMDLHMCMAKIVCPLQHSAAISALQSNNDSDEEEYHVKVEAALDNMSACVAAANQRTVLAKKQHANLFEK